MNAKKVILQALLTTQVHIVVVLTFQLSFQLQDISTTAFDWFGNNHITANPDKCHLFLSTKSPEVVSIDGIQITSST